MVSLPFHLDAGFTLQVKKGDSVKVGDTLAARKNTGEQTIPLASIFNSNPQSIKKYIRVSPGDKVSVGDVLAIRKSMLREDKILSEVNGTVMAYERSTGDLVIHPSGSSSKDEEIRSPIDGIVTVCNNDQIVIETEKDVILGESGSGTQAEGILTEPESVSGSSSLLYALDTRITGKILLLASSDRDTLLKAIGMDVGGILIRDTSDSDIEYLVKRNIPTPVVQLSDTEWKKVIRWVGQKIFVDAKGKTILLLHV